MSACDSYSTSLKYNSPFSEKTMKQIYSKPQPSPRRSQIFDNIDRYNKSNIISPKNDIQYKLRSNNSYDQTQITETFATQDYCDFDNEIFSEKSGTYEDSPINIQHTQSLNPCSENSKLYCSRCSTIISQDYFDQLKLKTRSEKRMPPPLDYDGLEKKLKNYSSIVRSPQEKLQLYKSRSSITENLFEKIIQRHKEEQVIKDNGRLTPTQLNFDHISINEVQEPSETIMNLVRQKSELASALYDNDEKDLVIRQKDKEILELKNIIRVKQSKLKNLQLENNKLRIDNTSIKSKFTTLEECNTRLVRQLNALATFKFFKI